MVQKKGFNLLKNQIEPQTMWTKVYFWTTSTARGLLVMVELVIVVSFAFRVVVDLQFKNLNKDITTKEEIVLMLQDSEKRLRDIQNKVFVYEKLSKETLSYNDVYREISRIVPSSIRDLSVQINREEITVKGTTDTESIARIENSFKSSQFFTKTELVNVETQGTKLDNFTLKTKINQLHMRGS